MSLFVSVIIRSGVDVTETKPSLRINVKCTCIARAWLIESYIARLSFSSTRSDSPFEG